MGNSAAKERFEKAAKTKILTANGVELDDWDDTLKLSEKLLPNDVRTFNLSGNKIKAPLPKKFLTSIPCILSTVRLLDLSDNKLADVSALAFDLEPFLTMSVDKLSTTLVPSLKAPSGGKNAFIVYPLETLNLSKNKLQSLPPMCFARFPKLKQLDLSHNELNFASVAATGADPSVTLGRVFMATPSLVSINLSNNALTFFPIFPFASSPSDIPPALATCPKVMDIDMTNNKIVTLASNGVDLPALKSLVMSQNVQLRKIDVSVFVNFSRMTHLLVDGIPTAQTKAIFDALHPTDEYQKWLKERASDVNRQLAGGLVGTLAN